MADGCNLYFTEKDLKDVESSIENKEVLNEGKFAANALDCLLKKNADKFINVLWDKNDPKHKMISNLTIKSLGEGKVSRSEEAKIPSALKSVLQFTKYPQGLFSKQPIYRGPGADRMRHPYELLTAAKLVDDRKLYTTTGKPLHLYNTDRIDFGYKHEGHFWALTKGDTFESDVLITREDGRQVGIDSKYRSDEVCRLKEETREQINRIQNGISARQIESYYFVTNGIFSTSFHNAVRNIRGIELCEQVNF